MNTHLTTDEFILAYYAEPGVESRTAHLDSCAECRAELARLASVLDQVTPVEPPEPDTGYEQRVWERLSWRLPAEKKRAQTGSRLRWLALAAVVALAFAAGLLTPRRTEVTPATVAGRTAPQSVQPAANGSAQQSRDRILLVVVSDHFDESERMLLELTNLDPTNEADISVERGRAEELLASNRLYRQTATSRGEEQVATLLDELEPILMQIAHAPSQVTASEVQAIQKRVEAKGLVFKLRVVKAETRKTAVPHMQQPTI
jgi:hypothetical protein